MQVYVPGRPISNGNTPGMQLSLMHDIY